MAQATLRLIDRGDLLAALDSAAARKVTIISAPAGSGKTSLLRAWADRPGQPYRLAIVQVRRDQHDAQDFCLAVLQAVRRVRGAPGGAEAAAATPDFNAPAMADRVLSELAGAGGDVMLVIEDLHELNSPEALGQLTRLLTNLPVGVHALLTTRYDLPLRLHQLRLAGELAEIRAADLRFTERETRELLAASGITLSQAGVALLHQRTEGWAAGLRLAALSLAAHPDPERFVADFSGTDRAVAEYLLAEMLDRQPGDVQDLLLRTCLLDRVNGELADLLTGRPGSERILLELEDANAFVVSLDPQRTWFRYHHLFGDLLRLELRRTLPDQVPALHRRAAEWLSEHGQVVDAIRHTQAAGDWSDASRLLLLLHQTTGILRACTGRRQEALEEFSAAERLRSRLAGSHALASQVTGWLLATQARLGMTAGARAGLEALDDERATSAEISNARAVICLADGDPGAALGAVRDVLDGTAPVVGYVTLVEAHLLAGLAYRRLGDSRAANQAAERALALAEADRLVLPFAITGSGELLAALPRHETAHAGLLADILDVLGGGSVAAKDQAPLARAEELSPGELKVLRYLPTNLSRPEIAAELSVSVNTVSTHIRSIYAKLRVSDRSSAVQRARELRLLAAVR